MEATTIGGSNLGLEMETVERYRRMAEGYRCSDEYSKMINLYPVLQTSINDCKDEKLIN